MLLCSLHPANRNLMEVPKLSGRSIEGHLNKLGPPPELFRDFFRDLDIESANLRRIARIGFHKWRTASGIIASPRCRLRFSSLRSG
jgi:hypothetical protein